VSDVKHTPGPWICEGSTVFSLNDDGLNRMWLHVERHGRPEGESEANARLIAAAPELLEACKAMRKTMYSPDSLESRLADAAIAKAE